MRQEDPALPENSLFAESSYFCPQTALTMICMAGNKCGISRILILHPLPGGRPRIILSVSPAPAGLLQTGSAQADSRLQKRPYYTTHVTVRKSPSCPRAATGNSDIPGRRHFGIFCS